MKKIVGLLLIILLAASCSKEKAKYVIAVSQCSEDIWRDKLNRELKMNEYYNDSIEVRLASANDDNKKQIAQINAFTDEGVDLLIIAPNQLNSIASAVERAHERGIPVILYDRKVNSTKYTAFIGGDNYGMGKLIGQFVAARMHGHGRVVEIRGLEESSPAAERHRGFVDALKAFPDVHLVASEAGNWKQESGRQAMERILQTTRDFDYVFGQNDRMALGARQAAMAHGITRGVHYVGIDALATKGGGIELVRDGIFEASFVYPTKGDEVVALAMNILQGKKFSRENLLSTTVVTPENAELMLRQARDEELQNRKLDFLHNRVNAYFSQYNAQKWLTVVLLVLLMGFIAVTLLAVRAYLIKKKLNERLAKSNEEQRRLTQEVKDMTRMQLAFFTNVSHELRTPLTLIADPVDRMMASGELRGENGRLMLMVQRNVRILLQLVNQILDFRKYQNGKMKLRLSRFALADAVQTWSSNFDDAAARKGITIVTEPGDADSTIVADEEKIAHLYFNLMSNAMKYTPAKGRISTTLRAEGDRLVLTVSDTGMGIAPEELPHIFDRFYQASGATGGTGIGLALVKAMADMHHGEVSATSEMGKGTTFTVKLPRTQEGEVLDGADVARPSTAYKVEMDAALATGNTPNAARHIDDVVSTEVNEKPEVLVIDDNSDVRGYLRMVLKDRYHVSEAVDGKSGLALARKTVPDLVVCDVMMPVMDGLEFTRLLKQELSTSHIPVILLTARSLDDHMAEGFEYGADSYITKPFSTRVLLSRIDNLLQSRQQLRHLFALGDAGKTSEAQQKAEKAILEKHAPTPGKTSASAPMGDRDQQFIAHLRTIIHDNMADSDLNVERIGEQIGLSRVQLYRKVKALTGLSPVELIRSARLQRGKKLLESSDMSISEVAYDVGFTSPSYFAKCFKDEFGMSPNELRS